MIDYTHGGISQFEISKSVYDEMMSYSEAGLPYEVCGLLSGKQSIATTLWKIKNESKHVHRFYMSKESIEKAVTDMEERGERLLGIFHSHPTSHAYPSQLDIRSNPYSQLPYLIVSLKGIREIGCFILSRNKAYPLTMTIIDE